MFPLGYLGRSVPDEVEELEYIDHIEHPVTGEPVERKLTITPSRKYGLPTFIDDEVLFALLQLSARANDLTEAVNEFSGYQLIRMLRWDKNKQGWNYRRLRESLNRWVGVTLYYDNAWWNQKRQTWVDEKFHVLDNVSIPRNREDEVPWSIVWNRVLLASFRAGNVKKIDMDLYHRLELPGSRRALRYLNAQDAVRLELGLRDFACAHIGLSPHYATGKLKERLLPFLGELVREGFLEDCPPEARFKKVRRGDWRVVVVWSQGVADGKREETDEESNTEDPLVSELTSRGVTSQVAQELVGNFDAGRIRKHVGVFDWRKAGKEGKRMRNPGGYLRKMIEEDWPVPEAYLAEVERSRRAEEQAARREAERETIRRREEEADAERAADRKRIEDYLAALDEEGRARLEGEASAWARETDHWAVQHLGRTGVMGEAGRRHVVEGYVRHRLAHQGAARPAGKGARAAR